MKKTIIILFCAFCCIPIFSQEYYNNLSMRAGLWNAAKRDSVLIEKIHNLFNYQQDRFIPLINFAKENYEVVTVFHADLTCKNDTIAINLVNNDFPMNLYYVNNKDIVKLIVLSYGGEVEIVDTEFRALIKGLAKREAKAFRYIIKQHPDLIFICEDVYGCYFYVKNNIIYVYDYYHKKRGQIQQYRRLMDSIIIE